MERMISNYVEVEIDDSNEWYDRNGLKIKLDISFEPEKNAQVIGIVKRVPNELWYNKKDPNSMEYKIAQELSVGDRVIFHFLSVSNAKKEGRINGNILYLPYTSLFAIMGDPYPQPINGWLLVRPCKKKKDGFLDGVGDEFEISKKKGWVIGAGAMVEEYRVPDVEDSQVPIGSFIHFKRQDAIPLFYSVQDKVGELLYRMRRKDVLAIEQVDDDGGPVYNHATGRCDL